jgi:translocation and assembly module TamB
VGAGALLLVTFIGASVVAAVVHLGTKPARRIAAQTLNDVLHGSLAGEVHLGGLRRLGPFRISIDDMTVNDPHGGRALWLHDVDARLNAFEIARSALLGKESLEITVHALSIDHAEIVADQGPSTALTLQESFQPREFGPPQAEDPRARPLDLKLEQMRLGSAWIHGVVAPPRAIDADIHGLAGRFALLPDGIQLDLEPTEIEERIALPVKVAGTAKGRYEAHGDTTVADGGFQGTVGTTGVAFAGSLDGDRVAATIDVPRVVPEALKPFVADPPLTRPIRIQVRADGVRTVISIEARLAEVDAPARAVVVESALDVADPLRAAVDVGIHGMDPSLFAAKAPAASIDARITARVALAGGSPSVVADVHTEATEVVGKGVPAVDVHVDFAGGRITGTLDVAEDGAPITGTFAMTTEDRRARFEVLGAVPALHASPRIAALIGDAVDGSLALKVKGSYEDGQLDAQADTTFSVQKGKTDVALRHGEIHGRARGPLDGLTVEVALDANGLNAYGRAFDRVTARVEGPVKAPRVQAQLASAARFISASAEIDAEAQSARRIRLSLRHGANTARASVDSVDKRGEVLRVSGLSFDGVGVGAIRGSIAMDPRGVTGKVHGEALDVARIVDLAALPMDARGLASFDVALARGLRGPEGHIALELEDGAYGDTQGMSAHLTTTLDGDDLRADGYVRLIAPRTEDGNGSERRIGEREEGPTPAQAGLTRKELEAEALARRAAETCSGAIAKLQIENGKAKIHGAITDARTWEGLRGETTIRAEDLDLRCLEGIAPVKLPDSIGDIGGALSAKLRVVRDGASALPSVRDVSVATRGLVVRGPKDPETGSASWESRALDVALNADFDAVTGRAQGAVTVHDDRVILDLSAATTVDMPALLDPERRKRAIEALPIAAHLAIPRRAMNDLRSLPSMVRAKLPPIAGEVQLDVYAAGTIHEPHVAVRAMGFKLREEGAVDGAGGPLEDYDFPLDLDASAFYDSHAGEASVFVSHQHAELARGTAKVKADLDAVRGAKPGAAISWKGGMKATITDLPLGKLPYIVERKVGGVLCGEVDVEGLNEKPKIAVALQAYDMRMGPDMFLEKANVALHVGPADGKGDKAVLKPYLLGQDGGSLTAAADLGVVWKNGAVPMVEPKRGASAMVASKRFRLSAAQPFLGETLSKLDGYLDGRIDLTWAHIDEAQSAQMSGSLKLTDGVIDLPTMGQELRNASLTIVADPSGTIHVNDMKAEGRSGSFHGSARASIADGEFKNAHAELEISNGEDLPITIEGVPFGMARGKVSVDAQNKGTELAVAVKIPAFHIALPSSIGKSVQPITPNEDIRISPRLLPPEKKLAQKEAVDDNAKEATTIVIGVDLGDIHIEGQGVDATLTGSPEVPLRIVIDAETKVGGDIRITRGKVEVLGKVFEIEQGSLVHLRPEDTSNPFMNVTAAWNSPDGTRVYIDYIGNLEPITHEKIRFRSDPPKSQQEVVNLLLFGPEHEQGSVAGGASAGPNQSASQTASNLAAAGGSSLASSQINQILSGIGPLQGLDVKLGTDDAGALRTSLGYKLGRNVTATASFGGSGSAASGSSVVNANSPAATNATEFGLEWRFQPHWSLRASVGTGAWTSTGLDVLWTRRY